MLSFFSKNNVNYKNCRSSKLFLSGAREKHDFLQLVPVILPHFYVLVLLCKWKRATVQHVFKKNGREEQRPKTSESPTTFRSQVWKSCCFPAHYSEINKQFDNQIKIFKMFKKVIIKQIVINNWRVCESLICTRTLKTHV